MNSDYLCIVLGFGDRLALVLRRAAAKQQSFIPWSTCSTLLAGKPYSSDLNSSSGFEDLRTEL